MLPFSRKILIISYINVVLQKRGTNGEEEEAGGGQEAGGFLVCRHLPQHEQARAADQHAEASLPGDASLISTTQLERLCCSRSQTRVAKRTRSSSLMTTTCF